MLQLSNLVFCVTIFTTCNYAYVASMCQLKIGLPSPLFSGNFGTKTVIFRAHEEEITLDDKENITAHCPTGEIVFQYEYYNHNEYLANRNDKKTASFVCFNKRISVDGKFFENIKVSCSNEPILNLYESSTNLTKCEGLTTYAIGYKLPLVGDTIAAAICYDLDRLKLKYVSYFAYPKRAEISFSNSSENWVSANLGVKTNVIQKYFKFIDTNSISENVANEFSVENILQDDAIKSKTYGYEYLLNTIWWRQLRLANWHYFLEALRQRTESGKYAYVVNVGTYGNITLPSALTNCPSAGGEVFTVRTEDMVVQAPAYIWAYVQSREGTNIEEDFVVIGHNSPYVKDPGHQSFCDFDVCDKIDWLKESKFGKLRQLPTLGYTFCCRAEGVAKVIDNFPLKVQSQMDNNEAATITTTDDNDDSHVYISGENEPYE